MAESVGALGGPLAAGLLVASGGPTAVFGVAAAGNLAGSLLVLPVVRWRGSDHRKQRVGGGFKSHRPTFGR